MDSVVNAATIQSLSSLSEEDAVQKLVALNAQLGTQSKFEDIDRSAREELVKLVEKLESKPPLFAPVLELIRILARDKALLDVLLTESVRYFIIRTSGLSSTPSAVLKDVIEADKCLVNTLFNSAQMRQTFEAEAVDLLLERISAFTRADYSGRYEWINGIPEDSRNAVWLFDLRIAFLTSAHSSGIQSKWGSSAVALTTFIDIMRQYTATAAEVECLEPDEASRRLADHTDRAGEAAKVLFNITYKRPNDIDEKFVNEITEVVAALIKAKPPSPVMEQHAVNLLSTLKLNIGMLCPKMTTTDGRTEQFDLYDMSFAQALLDALERKLDDNNNSDSDLLSTYFGSLLKLCTASKEARRYCRLKVQMILPPLVAADVARRPDEGETLRNKVIRVMMSPVFSKDLASEFMFVLCKRSVNRLIKYTGLGHSAGLLANAGLLGHINAPKSASDSEDSETDEYRSVEDKINPVTGCIRPEPTGPSPLDGMSEEQKEYEAMKLVNAMNKLMKTGVVKPGTVGPDGRPREVSHVLELLKDVPDEEPHSDSD
ncbi:hypothetical protein ANCDUO_05878 [Ancylostoma duodenale]|uniref:Synembryn n=1 Tax=Ancylostoma duodenale TaxID=51022 RepID=A0A0C2GR75_9BILA|nr:hypothetical protein ANCDUO_05878 [Ancylostoma duodenale]